MSSVDYPLHRLNTPQTILWHRGDVIRRPMAALLISKFYRGGCGILDARNDLIAMIDPRGTIHHMKPPFRRFRMHEIANRPAVPVCQCAEFFDPESQGKWKQRNTTRHHPMCQFVKYAEATFEAAMRVKEENPDLAKRPDAWHKLEEQVSR